MIRPVVCILAIAFGSSPLGAQARTWWPDLLVGAGLAGQYEDGTGLGHVGGTAALGVEWRVDRAWGARLEAQTFRYQDEDLAIERTTPGAVERLDVLAALAIWNPRMTVPISLLGGVALFEAQVPVGASHTDGVVRGTAVVGVTIGASSRLGLDVQYLHTGAGMGETSGVLATRLVLRM